MHRCSALLGTRRTRTRREGPWASPLLDDRLVSTFVRIYKFINGNTSAWGRRLLSLSPRLKVSCFSTCHPRLLLLRGAGDRKLRFLRLLAVPCSASCASCIGIPFLHTAKIHHSIFGPARSRLQHSSRPSIQKQIWSPSKGGSCKRKFHARTHACTHCNNCSAARAKPSAPRRRLTPRPWRPRPPPPPPPRPPPPRCTAGAGEGGRDSSGRGQR